MLVRLPLLLALVAAPTALAGNGGGGRQCPLALTTAPTGTDQWQLACTEGFQQSTEAVTFESSAFQTVKISSNATATTLQPATKPTDVTVPKSFSKVGALTSSSVTSFTMEGTSGAAVELETTCFTKMTALRRIKISSVNITVNGQLELPASLNEISVTRAGLVDFKVKLVQGATSYNITKIDLSYNRLRYIPLPILASSTLESANLEGNDLSALRMSTRKLERFVRLVTSKRLIVGTIADFKETCTDGEAKKITVGDRTIVVCQVPKESDDDAIVQSSGSMGGSEEEVSSSVVSQQNSSSSSWTETVEISENGTKTVTTTVNKTVTTTVTTTVPSTKTTSAASALLSWTFGAAGLVVAAAVAL